MSIRIYIFKIKKQTSKQKKQNKTKREYKKAKETKEEKRTSPENRLKKNCGRPGEDFSRHLHFRKQELFFFFFQPYCTALDSHILVAPNLIK